MRIRSHHMGLAIGVAAVIHVAAAIAMALEPPPKGAAGSGSGGIQVSLGPSGGAPGSQADVVSEIDTADAVDPAAAPSAEPDVTPPDTAEREETPPDAPVAETVPPTPIERDRPDAVEVAEAPPPVSAETEIPEALAETPPEVAPTDLAIEPAERVEPVDEVVAIAPPEKTEPVAPPRPVEVARADVAPAPVEPVAPPVEVTPAPPEPMTVARVIPARVTPETPPVDAPPLPVARPRPPVPEKTEVERAPPVRQAAAAVEAPAADTSRPAPAQSSGAAGRSGVGQAQQSGSAQASSGGGRPGVSVDYVSILQAWLEDHKEYPRRARSRRQEGVVWLYFVMDRAGRVLEHRIDRSSGHRLLDREVEEMIRRAEPLPALPPDMTQARLELVVPVQFQLR